MSIQEFQENNIIDPNLRPKSEKRIVTPREMGFTHEETVKKGRPEDPILDDLDKAIERKQREAFLMSNAIDESDGEGISEDEFQDLLVQARDEIEDDGIPTADEIVNEILPNHQTIISKNPTSDIMDELEEELEKDEKDYYMNYDNNYEMKDTEHQTITASRNYVEDDNTTNKNENINDSKNVVENENPFKNFVSSDIDFDEEFKELDDNIDEAKLREKEQKEQVDKLRHLIKEKISPVTKTFDISTYSISKKPASNTISTPRDKGEKIADWVLMSSQRPIYMRKFTGTEIVRLSDNKGRTRLNRALDTWKLIYDHIVDPYKPSTLEEWARVTSFLDIDHIYMAIYRANFDGSNYIPYNCTNTNCKEVFLSDNFDIIDMCKFKSDEDKNMFNSILGSECTPAHSLYTTELVPVSDEYAFAFREPSIYNIIFESAMLDEEFVNKFDELVSICTYIDAIYKIDHVNKELQPVRTNVYPNNMKKTLKSRIINYSKYISNLDSDQYNTIVAYINKINESGDKLTYKLPEVTCPKCKTVIKETETTAQDLVFTRHQLAALATI